MLQRTHHGHNNQHGASSTVAVTYSTVPSHLLTLTVQYQYIPSHLLTVQYTWYGFVRLVKSTAVQPQQSDAEVFVSDLHGKIQDGIQRGKITEADAAAAMRAVKEVIQQ